MKIKMAVLILALAIVSAILLSSVSEFSNVTAANVVNKNVSSVPIPKPVPTVREISFPNKLYIVPRYKFITAKPGESYNFTVFVKNTLNKSVSITPVIKPVTFSPSTTFLRWVKVSPSKITLKSGESTNLNFTVEIPKNVVAGSYSCEVILTNDTLPIYKYEYARKIYVNSVHITAVIQPPIRIYPKYFYEQVMYGNDIKFNVSVVNTGSKCYSLNPVVKPSEFSANTLNNSLVNISAPKIIPPHSKVNVEVFIRNLPPGSYFGSIYMNINDSELSTYQQTVNLHINVIKPPEKPYVKEFYVKRAKYLNVSVSLSCFNNANFVGKVELISPDRKLLEPKKIEEDITVNYIPTNQYMPQIKSPYNSPYNSWEYKTEIVKKVYTFIVKNPEKGLWKVSVKSPYTIKIKILKNF